MCGGSNPVQDLVSSASDALASIDPGPAIGQGLSEVDTFVNREVPGGWTLPAAIAAAYATGYVDPSLFASEYGTAITTEAGQDAFFTALSNGASSAEALNAGLAAESIATGGVGALTTDEILGSGGFIPTEGSSFVIDPNAAYNALEGAQVGGLDFADIVKDTPGFSSTPEGNIIQTFDDGSTITLDSSGNVIGTTEAIEPIQIPGVVKDAAQSLAKQAANKLLSTATNKLATGLGVKSGLNLFGGTGTLGTGADQNITASTSQDFANLTPDLVKGNPNFSLNDFVNLASNAPQTFSTPTNPAISAAPSQAYAPLSSVPTQSFKTGGDVEGHNPTFFSPGGLASMENTYVKGEGDGTSDSVAAMLADGEFVIPADVVSKLGNGSNDAGAEVLDEFLSTIRAHAQKHDPKELPPDSKGPLAYLADAKKKARV